MYACNGAARKRGIAVGMPLSEVLALVRSRRGAVIEPVQSEVDRAAMIEMAIDCEKFSPCVGLEEEEQPQGLLLDITGIAHLFGGEQALAEQIRDDFCARRFHVRIAIGDSIGAAWAAAHFLGGISQPIVIPPMQHQWLGKLPIEGLRLQDKCVEKLHRLGIKNIQQLLGLDRSSFPSRFGNEINLRLDQFIGAREELIVPCRPTPKFQVEQSFENSIRHTEVIDQALLGLLERLVGLLRARQWGMRQLECQFFTEMKAKQDVMLRLCKPSADARQIAELLRLKMEPLHFGAPISSMRLEALETCPMEQSQQDFFAGRSQSDVRQVSALLNRLSSRLGHQAVVRPQLQAEAIPERAVLLQPVTDESLAITSPSHKMFLPLDRPTCLFPQPRPVEVMSVVPDGPPSVLWLGGRRFDIVRHRGPERIETGWWQGPEVCRDYYRLETTEGRRFWLFRRVHDARWFLHGEML